MRIITGKAKGHNIGVPTNKHIRPAQDMVRQAVFSMLKGLVENARVLDLYAGTGSYGLEALSRGAKKAIFVDIDQGCTRTIKQNLQTSRLESRGEVEKAAAQQFVNIYPQTGKDKFDLIFLSPPYKEGKKLQLLKSLSKILKAKGVIVFDHSKETNLPQELDNLKIIRQRTYGETAVSILTNKLN
ncbi:MAG: 16S rRNA (guanine(966)-N(2))-methyltransferase RsmD [Patescibacteria group bacterium]